jgi:hypothetical protein
MLKVEGHFWHSLIYFYTEILACNLNIHINVFMCSISLVLLIEKFKVLELHVIFFT